MACQEIELRKDLLCKCALGHSDGSLSAVVKVFEIFGVVLRSMVGPEYLHWVADLALRPRDDFGKICLLDV